MFSKSCFIKIVPLLLLFFSFSACSDNNYISTDMAGVASKGPVIGGSATAYEINADGTKGDELGTATTNNDGSFNMGLGSYRGSVLVEVVGGTYVDEATGNTVNNTMLRAIFSSVQGRLSVAVTPFTEMATQYAENLGSLSPENIDAANDAVSDLLGGIDINATKPIDASGKVLPSASQEEIDYGLMLAAVSQMSADTGLTVDEAISNLTDDLADGYLDTSGPELTDALEAFIESEHNATEVTSVFDTEVTNTLVEFVPSVPKLKASPIVAGGTKFVEAATFEITLPVSRNTAAAKITPLTSSTKLGSFIELPTSYKAESSDRITITFKVADYEYGDYYPVVNLYDKGCLNEQGLLPSLIDAMSCRSSAYKADVKSPSVYYAIYNDSGVGTKEVSKIEIPYFTIIPAGAPALTAVQMDKEVIHLANPGELTTVLSVNGNTEGALVLYYDSTQVYQVENKPSTLDEGSTDRITVVTNETSFKTYTDYHPFVTIYDYDPTMGSADTWVVEYLYDSIPSTTNYVVSGANRKTGETFKYRTDILIPWVTVGK